MALIIVAYPLFGIKNQYTNPSPITSYKIEKEYELRWNNLKIFSLSKLCQLLKLIILLIKKSFSLLLILIMHIIF